MHIFASLTKVEGALQMGDISRPSSRQADLAGDSIANTVSPTIDLVARILVGLTVLIRTLVALKRICLHKSYN